MNTTTDLLTIAVSKGYLWNEGKKRLEKIGFQFTEDAEDNRKLYAYDVTGKCRILKVRPWDVSAYVEQGAADLGIVGKDVLLETGPNVLELLDLKFGKCSLVLAGLDKVTVNDLQHNIVVATKYWNSTISYFKARGLKINPIKLYGAVELAPTTGIADIICDLTATGTTIRENKLHIIDTVFESTARLVANHVSIKVHFQAIKDLVNQLEINE